LNSALLARHLGQLEPQLVAGLPDCARQPWLPSSKSTKSTRKGIGKARQTRDRIILLCISALRVGNRSGEKH